MTMPAPTVFSPAEDRSLRRWAFAAIAVILVHAGLALWLMRDQESSAPAGAPPDAVMIELAPVAVSPPEQSVTEATPGPQMTQAELEAVEPPQAMTALELPPAPKPDAVLLSAPQAKPRPPKKIAKPRPKAVVKREREPPATRTSAPVHTAARAATSAAASQAAAGASSMSASNWRGLVSAQLNRNKRYPDAAQGQHGTASISFTIDRGGRLVAARLVGSSGSAILDQEAVAMAHRASPFPPPPPEVGGSHIGLTVPVRFR